MYSSKFLFLLFSGEANSILNGISVAIKSKNTFRLISDFIRTIVDFEELVIEEIDAYEKYQEKITLSNAANGSNNSKNETKYSTKNRTSTLSWLEQMATQIAFGKEKTTTPTSSSQISKGNYNHNTHSLPTTTPTSVASTKGKSNYFHNGSNNKQSNKGGTTTTKPNHQGNNGRE